MQFKILRVWLNRQPGFAFSRWVRGGGGYMKPLVLYRNCCHILWSSTDREIRRQTIITQFCVHWIRTHDLILNSSERLYFSYHRRWPRFRQFISRSRRSPEMNPANASSVTRACWQPVAAFRPNSMARPHE